MNLTQKIEKSLENMIRGDNGKYIIWDKLIEKEFENDSDLILILEKTHAIIELLNTAVNKEELFETEVSDLIKMIEK